MYPQALAGPGYVVAERLVTMRLFPWLLPYMSHSRNTNSDGLGSQFRPYQEAISRVATRTGCSSLQNLGRFPCARRPAVDRSSGSV